MNYDVIIIGAGSAGLPAGMYCSRYNLHNLIIGRLKGGALATSHKVENYPGTISAPGREIMDRFYEHAEKSGSEIILDNVNLVEKIDGGFKVKTDFGKEFTSKFIIFAAGSKYKKLGCPGEKHFLGRGVSYCATCDGMFFRGKEVAVVGGGNTALTDALFLAEICSKVYLIHRRDTFRADNVRVEKAKKSENIEFVLNDEVLEILGENFVQNLNLKSGKNISVSGIFIAIGSESDTSVIDHLNPEKDSEGCLVVNSRQQTSISGIYAAGDVTTGSNKFRQTITSAAEGCIAANSVHEDFVKGS